MLDIHAHILPGVDDGAADDATAVEMLKAARKAGIDRIVATPHIRKPHALERAGYAFGRTRDLAEGFGIRLVLGCELSVRMLAGCAITPEALAPYAIGGTRALLLEFPSDAPPVDWAYLLSGIRRAGLHVIIAHPERCRYVARDLSLAKEMVGYGCELQLDARSLMRGRFSAERRAADRLLEGGLAAYIASDAHRPRDYEALSALRHRVGKSWPTGGVLETLIQ